MASPPILPDQLRRHRALGMDAVYRVVAEEGEHVIVEVVCAPGLEQGERYRFLARTVAAMECLPSEDAAHTSKCGEFPHDRPTGH